MNTNGKPLSATAVKALAIVGVVAILFIGLWGVVQIVRGIPGVFSAIGAAAVSLSEVFVGADRIEIKVEDVTVVHGEPFTLSWKHTSSREGSYTLSYPCRDGSSFDAPDASGQYKKTFCNTPFNFTGATSEMRLIPYSERNRYIDVPVVVSFTPKGKTEVSAESEILLTIENNRITGSPTTTGTPTTPTTPVTPVAPTTPRTPGTRTDQTYRITGGGVVSDPNGRVDLSVRILETGVIDRNSNTFTRTGAVRKTDRAAVRFVVENLGTKVSPHWSFNAPLPTFPFYIFQSDLQRPLNPGDRIEFTLGFDNPDPAQNGSSITVNVDPTSSIPEVTKTNNIAKVFISIQ